MMRKEFYFPTPVYIKDIEAVEYNNHLEKVIIELSEYDKGKQATNVKGWHSSTNIHENIEFKNLVNELYNFQFEIFKDEYLDGEPFLGNMWANINPPQSFNMPHTHPNSLWSGVYYVKTPKNCGDLKIEDPRMMSYMVQPKRKIKPENLPLHLLKFISFQPIAGRIIMFPSWLRHYVEINNSNDFRMSISFNFIQKGVNF